MGVEALGKDIMVGIGVGFGIGKWVEEEEDS